MTLKRDEIRRVPRPTDDPAVEHLRRLDATLGDAARLLAELRRMGVQVITRAGYSGGQLGHSAEHEEFKITSALRGDDEFLEWRRQR